MCGKGVAEKKSSDLIVNVVGIILTVIITAAASTCFFIWRRSVHSRNQKLRIDMNGFGNKQKENDEKEDHRTHSKENIYTTIF